MKKVTYGWLMCDTEPEKSETHRMSLAVGVNVLYLIGNLNTPTDTVTTERSCLIVWYALPNTSVLVPI